MSCSVDIAINEERVLELQRVRVTQQRNGHRTVAVTILADASQDQLSALIGTTLSVSGTSSALPETSGTISDVVIECQSPGLTRVELTCKSHSMAHDIIASDQLFAAATPSPQPMFKLVEGLLRQLKVNNPELLSLPADVIAAAGTTPFQLLLRLANDCGLSVRQDNDSLLLVDRSPKSEEVIDQGTVLRASTEFRSAGCTASHLHHWDLHKGLIHPPRRLEVDSDGPRGCPDASSSIACQTGNANALAESAARTSLGPAQQTVLWRGELRAQGAPNLLDASHVAIAGLDMLVIDSLSFDYDINRRNGASYHVEAVKTATADHSCTAPVPFCVPGQVRDRGDKGLIQVHLAGMAAESKGAWCRYLQPFGGPGTGAAHGSFNLPRVNDMVLVYVDPRCYANPVVLGSISQEKTSASAFGIGDNQHLLYHENGLRLCVDSEKQQWRIQAGEQELCLCAESGLSVATSKVGVKATESFSVSSPDAAFTDGLRVGKKLEVD